MKVEIVENKNLACIKVANALHQQILKKKNSTIGLATGNTMRGVYDAFKVLVQEHKTDLSSVKFFMLDEYWDISIDHPASFKSYLVNALSGLGIDLKQFHFHRTDLPAEEATLHYNKAIEAAGGIDLQLLGIGLNGHIGFNEPMTPFHQTTHVTPLTESTIQANAQDFMGANPTRAITMGIKNIMDAKSIVLLALGESKSEIMKRALQGAIDTECPASVLQKHQNLNVVLDQLAASKMTVRSAAESRI